MKTQPQLLCRPQLYLWAVCVRKKASI